MRSAKRLARNVIVVGLVSEFSDCHESVRFFRELGNCRGIGRD